MSFKAIRLSIAAALLVVAASVAPTSQAASNNLFAVVDQSGVLLSGNGVSRVDHLGIGQYEVTFTTDVSSCAYVATTQNAYSQALGVFTAGGHLGRNGVHIETKNQGGGLTDGPFNLVVGCGSPGMSYAVVGYNANLVRASSGTTLTSLGAGRYTLAFPASVENCAYIATVGDPGNGLALAPNGVYTGSGPTANDVYIETKNPGGGLADGIPFHLTVICPNAADAAVVVVGLDGLPVRGSSLTSSFYLGVGEYAVVTNRSLDSCARVATRGSINRDVPFSPATVEIVPALGANTSGVELRELLFFGGNLLNESFHAAMVCAPAPPTPPGAEKLHSPVHYPLHLAPAH